MNARKIIVIILAVFLCSDLYGQYENNDWGLSFNLNYTTTSKLYPFPNAIDSELRDQNVSIDDISSYSIELRYRISENFIIGLGTEYLQKTGSTRFTIGSPSGSIRTDITEGYSVIPIDFTAYYLLPFSTDHFLFYMGGGAGLYIGHHIRKFGGVETETVSREPAYGIHVNIGMDYLIKNFLSVRGEMKFRDPQFELKSKYNKDEVVLNGITYKIAQSEFDSKVNIDGVTFSIGLVLHF